MTIVRDDFSVEQMVELRADVRAMVSLHAVTLVDLVLSRSNDPVLREVATSMRELLAREHSLVAAIRAGVGG